jgi:hypothetical protein
MQKFQGNIKTKFIWIIPLLIGVSKNNIDNKANVYAVHITPFLEIGFNWKGTRNGYEKIKQSDNHE